MARTASIAEKALGADAPTTPRARRAAALKLAAAQRQRHGAIEKKKKKTKTTKEVVEEEEEEPPEEEEEEDMGALAAAALRAAAAAKAAAVAAAAAAASPGVPRPGEPRTVPCEGCARSYLAGKNLVKRAGVCRDTVGSASKRCWHCFGRHACRPLDPWAVPFARALQTSIEAETRGSYQGKCREALRLVFELLEDRGAGRPDVFAGYEAREVPSDSQSLRERALAVFGEVMDRVLPE
ncbi:hypothetical protein MY10362_000308 [Beauveria mimosiformis]